jgi:hypothetical protein
VGDWCGKWLPYYVVLYEGGVMNKFEKASYRAAFDECLSEYPEGMSVAKVLEGIGDNDDISVWQPYENWSSEEVCKQIASLAMSFRNFAEQHKGGE